MKYVTTIWRALYEHDGNLKNAKHTGVWRCEVCGFLQNTSAMTDINRFHGCPQCGIKCRPVSLDRETIENVLRD